MFISSENAQRIVDEIKAIIHYDLNMMDESGCIIASTNPQRIGQLHAGAQQVISQHLSILSIKDADEQQGIREGVNLPIILDDKIAGVIGITGDPAVVAVLGSVIQKMVELMIVEVRQQTLANLCEIARFNFVEQWLFTKFPNRNSFETQARLLDIDVDCPRILAVFEFDESGEEGAAFREDEQTTPELRNEKILKHLRVHAGHDRRNICVTVNRSYLVLFAGRDVEAVRGASAAICQDLRNFFGVPVYCGLSSVAEDYQQVAACYKEALAACRTVASSKLGFLAVYNKMSPVYILQSIPQEVFSRLEEAVFSRCPREDREALLHTLTYFFKYDGNSSAAAEALYIHSNTFLYRLKKVTTLTGLNPHKPRDAAVLYLLAMRYMLENEMI